MAETRVTRIYDEVAASYDQVGPPFYAVVGAELVDRTRVRPGDRVLDAGCGRGACLFPAAEAVGAEGQVTGIDVSPRMVSETSAEVAAPNITVQQGDAQAPDFPDASFDAVLSGFVLRMLPDPAAALHSYARLLRPGGRLGATIYAMSFDPRWQEVGESLDAFLAPGGPPPAVPLDPADRLASLVWDAGFEDVVVVDEPFDTLFTGAEQWWSYLWSSGYRGTLDRIPVERREEARRTVVAVAERLREQDGSLVMPQHVRIATATKAAS